VNINHSWVGRMTVSTEIDTHPESTSSRNLDFSTCRDTNSNWHFDVMKIYTEEFEFQDLDDSNGVTFSVETVIPCHQIISHTSRKSTICMFPSDKNMRTSDRGDRT